MLTDSMLIEGAVKMWALPLSRTAQRFCFSTLVSVLVSFNCQLGTVKSQEGRGEPQLMDCLDWIGLGGGMVFSV